MNSSDRSKVLVIGFGKMGMLHAAILGSMDCVDEVIIAEPSDFIAAGFKAFQPSRKIYRDYREALKLNAISAAVITTPNFTHFDILKELIENQVHVFVEKPLVVSYKEALRVLEISHRNPEVKIMSGYCLRFSETYLLARDYIAGGYLGGIRKAEARMHSSDVQSAEKGWRFRKDKPGGGVALDLGSHLIDLTRFFFGSPRALTGRTEKRFSKNVEDHCAADLSYDDFTVSFEACWSVPDVRKATAWFHIEGERGTLYVSNDEVDLVLNSPYQGLAAGRHHADTAKINRPVSFDLAGGFYTRQMEAFIRAVQNKDTPPHTLKDNLENHYLIDLLKTSEGQPKNVEMKPWP